MKKEIIGKREDELLNLVEENKHNPKGARRRKNF